MARCLDKCSQHFEKRADFKDKLGGGRAGVRMAKSGMEGIVGKGGMGMEGVAERYIIKSGLTPEEIRQGVLNFDIQDKNLMLIVRNLKGVLCDTNKIAQLNVAMDNYGNLNILDKVSALLAGISHIETYVQWFIRMEDFDLDCKRLAAHSDAPATAMELLMTHPGWLHTLKLILVIGNSMNVDIVPKGVYGFDLKSINKLRDTKSSQGYTFMEYLVEIIEEHFPSHSQFWKDFGCLNTGTKVSEKRATIVEEENNLKELVELLTKLLDMGDLGEGSVSKHLEKIETAVNRKQKSVFKQHGFVTKIIPLAKRLSSVMKKVKSDLQKGDEGFSLAKDFFSIESRSDGSTMYNIDAFMSDMQLFMNSLEDAYAKVHKGQTSGRKGGRASKLQDTGKKHEKKGFHSGLNKSKESARHKDHRPAPAGEQESPKMNKFQKLQHRLFNKS